VETMLKSGKHKGTHTGSVSEEDVEVIRCMDSGYLFVIREIMKQLRINEILEKKLPLPSSSLVKAMIIGKPITKGSKLCICNWLKRERQIGEMLSIDVDNIRVDDFYRSLGELTEHQRVIDIKWFKYHHLTGNGIYLYDITSTYFEGRQNELASFGYNRDGKKGKMQICIGLITDPEGFPLKTEVFKGNTIDGTTVTKQILCLKKEYGLKEIIFVGDRGMRISYHINNDESLKDSEIKYITGLTHAEIRDLLRRKIINMGLFDKKLVEIREGNLRYVLSTNPELETSEKYYLDYQKQRSESLLETVRQSWKKRNEKNTENQIKLASGKTKNKRLKTEFTEADIDKFEKRVNSIFEKTGTSGYFSVNGIDNDNFIIDFNEEKYTADESLCGKYILSSNVAEDVLSKEEIRQKYKNLQNVEHGFRNLKSDNISIRPVYHRHEAQTRGHVQVCLWAYAVIKKTETVIFPFLKKYNKENNSQLSFNDMIAELQNIKLCEIKIGDNKKLSFPKLNDIQEKLFRLFNINSKDMTSMIT
jgi:transposase